MEHFRDITSFHSIGRVLIRDPEKPSDVVDLLNFLSQVIFCDSVSVSVLGPKEITEGTLDVINKLEAMGVPEGFIKRYSYPDETERKLQRNRISSQLAIEWVDAFPTLRQGDKLNFPPGYYEMLEGTVDILSDALLTDTPISRYAGEIEDSLKDDQISYMVGLMLSNPNLTELIKTNFQKQSVSRAQLYDFIAIARNKYNLLLSEDLKLAFTPTTTRALKNKQTAHSLMKTYRSNLDKDPRIEMETLKLSGKEYQLSIPSAMHLLLSHKATSPEELIAKACKLREDLSWYREEVLTDFNRLNFSDSVQDKIQLNSQLEDAFEDVAGILASRNSKLSRKFLGFFSIDLLDYTNISGTGNGLKKFLESARNKIVFNRRKDCFLLTQELIHYMAKDDSDYNKIINQLFLDLGGEFKALIK